MPEPSSWRGLIGAATTASTLAGQSSRRIASSPLRTLFRASCARRRASWRSTSSRQRKFWPRTRPRPDNRSLAQPRLEEVREVLVEQDALVQIHLASGDLPAVVGAAECVDPLADEGALFVRVPVPV